MLFACPYGAGLCYLRPALSSHNQLTRLNTVSTMSRLETSPTSTRPPSTANFMRIPLIGTAGLRATEAGPPSLPSPAGSSLAMAQEGRARTGQMAFTGKAPVHLQRWHSHTLTPSHRGGLISPSAHLWTVQRPAHSTFSSPFKSVRRMSPESVQKPQRHWLRGCKCHRSPVLSSLLLSAAP